MRQGSAAGPAPTHGLITAENLRYLRIAAVKTIEETAPQVGVTPAYLSMMETGKKPIRPEIVIRLLRLYFAGEQTGK